MHGLDGSGFGATYSSTTAVDPGYSAGRVWADATGDGKADYCRVVGVTDKYLNCTPSTGTGFGATFGSGPVDAGYDVGRAWADATGDGRVDYCRCGRRLGRGPPLHAVVRSGVRLDVRGARDRPWVRRGEGLDGRDR